jgi:nitrite reductase/ring-hydroxylating ferredoxin subunit
MKCNRREFLRTGGSAIACTCLGGLCLSSCSPFSSVSNTPVAPGESYQIEEGRIVLDLDKAPGLAAIGGSVKLEFLHPAEGVPTKIILIHPEDSAYLAFANECSHKGKELEYDHSARRLRCASRHSEFDLNGNVLNGNAEKSLMGFPIERDWDTIIIKI